jgi:hypothetical protein
MARNDRRLGNDHLVSDLACRYSGTESFGYGFGVDANLRPMCNGHVPTIAATSMLRQS